MRKGIVLSVYTALLALLVAVPAYATYTVTSPYGWEIYSPAEQHGGSYDCPHSGRVWLGNGFVKGTAGGAYRVGKSIFIDNNGGNWIGAQEDNDPETLLWRPDLSGYVKKGSVKNTSSYTYEGYGRQWYDDATFCV